MDILRLMVKSILVIIMLAAFLEIVLPRSDMKRYVNLVIGLFVILAVLNPFLTLINKGLDLDVFDDMTAKTPDTESLIRIGKEMAAEDRTKATQQYREKLSRQIMGIAGMYQNTKTTGVDVEMVDDPDSENFGQIKKIIIHTNNQSTADNNSGSGRSPSAGVEVNVNEVNIGTENPEKNQAKAVDNSRGLKDVIADFYGLNPEQIEIETQGARK